MDMEKGFSLFEGILVIVLISIISAMAYPLFNHQSLLFQEKKFLDEFTRLLQYARQVAITSNCEVQVAYADPNTVALYQRQDCSKEGFTRKVPSFDLTSSDKNAMLVLPKTILLNQSLPLYMDKTGLILDSTHQWHPAYVFAIFKRTIYLDGFSGFIYEKQ